MKKYRPGTTQAYMARTIRQAVDDGSTTLDSLRQSSLDAMLVRRGQVGKTLAQALADLSPDGPLFQVEDSRVTIRKGKKTRVQELATELRMAAGSLETILHLQRRLEVVLDMMEDEQ